MNSSFGISLACGIYGGFLSGGKIAGRVVVEERWHLGWKIAVISAGLFPVLASTPH